jgi:hypothetical protein
MVDDGRVGSTQRGCAAYVEKAGKRSLVDEVVVELNALGRMATMEFALSVGRLIIDRFYGGEFMAWRSRGPKNASFRALAKHPELPMSPAALYRSVAMYELCVRLKGNSWKHLSTSHMRLVLPLGPDAQQLLLQEAERRRWTVRQLELEIGKHAGLTAKNGSGGLQKVQPARRLKAMMRALDRCLDASERLVGLDEGMMTDETRQMMAALEARLKTVCSALEESLARLDRGQGCGCPEARSA